MIVNRLAMAPNAVDVARRLTSRPGLTFVRAENGAVAYIACDPVEEVSALDPEPELGRARTLHGEVPRWFGLLPYECLRDLEGDVSADARSEPHLSKPLWLRYDAVLKVAEHVELFAESRGAAERLAALLARAPERTEIDVSLRSSSEPGAEHERRVRHALSEIERGNIYEANLARRFELNVRGSALELLCAFERAGTMPHSMTLEWQGLSVVAVSPELCLRLDPDGTLVTSPIKGTRPRHAEPQEDARLAAELDADPKERAELTMIIDVERNDFGRVAEIGSVHVSEAPRVVALPGLHHRVASVAARIRPGLERAELLSAVLPSGSVTGAPKKRAMQLIAELEPHRRGLYTGALGFVRRDGGIELKMAIRTLTVREGVGHYYAGGGIVADSIPEREVEETLWKAERLQSLLGPERSLG